MERARYLQKSPGGTVYQIIFNNSESSPNQLQYPNTIAPRTGYENIIRKSVASPIYRDVTGHTAASSSIPSSSQQNSEMLGYVNEHESESRLAVDADVEGPVAKKKKNEKERLCHVVHRDGLFEVEEYFLRLVFENHAIWNHTIEVKERHPEAKAKSWLNIQQQLVQYLKECDLQVSHINVETLKNTWNKIRENYVRFKNESNQSSGGATKEVDPPEHVEIMRTYDGMIQKRKQVSSLPDDEETGNNSEKNNFTPPNRKHKKKKKDDDQQLSPFLSSATTFLQKISDNNVNKSTPSDEKAEEVPDKCVLFANSIIPDLKQFDDEHFALIKMIISKEIYAVYLKQKEYQSQQ